MKFRKKPVVIEAVQWTGTNADEVLGFTLGRASVRDESFQKVGSSERVLVIETLEGDMRAEPMDWIICGVKGEFYPCKPDIFEATYEPAELAGPDGRRAPDHTAMRGLLIRLRRYFNDPRHERLEFVSEIDTVIGPEAALESATRSEP